jgi:hypothetical protein
MKQSEKAKEFRIEFLTCAVLTFIAVILAFMAIDDITTDNATSFWVERVYLICCGLWLLIPSAVLFWNGYRLLGAISFSFLILGATAQPFIGTGTIPGFQFEYVATIAALLWFLILTVILFFLSLPGFTHLIIGDKSGYKIIHKH